MAEAITAEKDGAKSVEPRRLSPGLAFFGALVAPGLGYLYVGRIGYAFSFVAVSYLVLFAAGWTRLVVDPVGWYTVYPALGVLWLVQLVHSVVLAWPQPLAPAKAYNRWWWYLAWIAGTSLAFEVLVGQRGTTLGYEFYYIPSGSMSPTVEQGDRLVVDTWRYRDAAPAFRDVVVCQLGEVLVVKRVVGVPGDTIELRGPLLVRNGAIVNEPYLSSERGMSPPDLPPLTLGADQFFVLGDNRGNSNDSRFAGPIGRDQISGRVEFVAYSRARGRFFLMLAPD